MLSGREKRSWFAIWSLERPLPAIIEKFSQITNVQILMGDAPPASVDNGQKFGLSLKNAFDWLIFSDVNLVPANSD